jgi:hypothetical protein
MFERKYHGNEWPSRAFPRTPEAVADFIIERVNTTSGLWQQFGFLCDLLVVPPEGGEVRYYEELPVDYVHDSDFGLNDDYYLITLEYGKDHDKDLINPQGDYRPHKDDPDSAHLSPGLHPIIRRFSGPELVREYHVLEDLYADWSDAVHRKPLLKFFRNTLGEPAAALV